MSQTRVSEALARPARTAGQLVPAAVLTDLVDVFLYDLDERQYATVLGALTLLFGFIQTYVENQTGKAFLRKIPPVTAPLVENTNVTVLTEDEDVEDDEPLTPESYRYGVPVSDEDNHGENTGPSVNDPYGDVR